MKQSLLACAALALVAACSDSHLAPGAVAETASSATAPQRPNILLVLADDLGFGDPRCYNQDSRIPTPAIDRLAAEGMRLTDMHSPAAVCTPTRYAMLTGRYAWRSSLQSGVLQGYSPALIEPTRDTLASLLKRAGYHTACIGKWHLGFGNVEPVDYSKPLNPSPLDLGFDRFFGIPASLDIPPYLFLEGNRAISPLSDRINKSKMVRNGGAGYWRTGRIAEGFRHKKVLDKVLQESQVFLRNHVASRSEEPFFLYVPLTAPHTPWLPTKKFRGASKAGTYGDFVAQVDDVLEQLLITLEDLGVAENTLVIFTSDNGAHWKPSDIQRYEHLANGPWRGQKADIYEGGHRVPFVLRWPGKVPAGSERSELLVLTDLFATFARIADVTPKPGAGEDSVNALGVWLNQQLETPPRDSAIHHALSGLFAIRVGNWKYIEGPGSGGFASIHGEDNGSGGQLYDLASDPTESNNLWKQHPEIIEQLQAQLNEVREGM